MGWNTPDAQAVDGLGLDDGDEMGWEWDLYSSLLPKIASLSC